LIPLIEFLQALVAEIKSLRRDSIKRGIDTNWLQGSVWGLRYAHSLANKMWEKLKDKNAGPYHNLSGRTYTHYQSIVVAHRQLKICKDSHRAILTLERAIKREMKNRYRKGS